MVLESTIICIDNSEYMRNGDFLPTRLQALQDAVGLVTQSKLRSNPESNVGLLTLGGLEVLTTLTTDTGKILAKLHAVQPAGKLRLISGIKIAHLALKHRQGKNHKTRIVAFIGSPVEADEKELMRIAKKLKKEKVNLDIVSFGEDQLNKDILEKFVNTVKGKDGTGSNLLNISMGPHLSDALLSSAIIQGEDGSGGIAAGAGFEFGVDPNEDPELALALRVSMEEQRARQEAETVPTTRDAETSEPGAESAKAGGPVGDEDAMLQKALSMSMETDEAAEVNLEAMTEEEQIAYAMRMSMAEHETGGEHSMEVDDEAKEGEEEDYSEVLQDPAFIQSVLENLPGVDPNSDAVQQAMGAMKKKDDEKKKEEDKK